MLTALSRSGVVASGMDRRTGISTAKLRDWLADVGEKETTMRLMAAIASKEGASIEEIADTYGWERETVAEWFDGFEAKPLTRVIDETERYNRARAAPFVPNRHPKARMECLDYEVLAERG